MNRVSGRKTGFSAGLLILAAICIANLGANGCCTTDCCLSDQCKEATKCVDPYVRTQRIVDDRSTGCPNVLSSITAIPGDTIRIVNCSSQKAHLDYTPDGIFNEGDDPDVAVGDTLVLTVKSTVTVPQIVELIVTGTTAGCSHPGSKVIVGQGP